MPVRSIVGLALTLLLAGPLPAENPSPGQDLKATIALNGFPCDRVVASKRNADSDYTATCKDGNRYRIFVNAKGRVVVTKL
ncbi:MAG TPA: hypothetical protein VL220_14580 [Steroidobacteraceae bacterium]|jgi:hypothetical protein|nr:hypothetical protein [Steroidobacteraceae bacterium]